MGEKKSSVSVVLLLDGFFPHSWKKCVCDFIQNGKLFLRATLGFSFRGGLIVIFFQPHPLLGYSTAMKFVCKKVYFLFYLLAPHSLPLGTRTEWNESEVKTEAQKNVWWGLWLSLTSFDLPNIATELLAISILSCCIWVKVEKKLIEVKCLVFGVKSLLKFSINLFRSVKFDSL